MTPAEFLALRKSLGLSQHNMALALGCNDATVAAYERGRRGISPQVAKHVELIAQVRAGKAVAKHA